MTGAGFGGCAVSIVRSDAVEAFIEQVGQRYEQRTGLKPEFYVAQVGKGAGPVYPPAAYQVEELLAYAIERDLIQRGDVVYCRNALLDLLQLEEPWNQREWDSPLPGSGGVHGRQSERRIARAHIAGTFAIRL